MTPRIKDLVAERAVGRQGVRREDGGRQGLDHRPSGRGGRRDRRDERMLGMTRFDRFDPDEGGVVEIGWTFLAPRCWGKGYNPEMKRAMLAHAFAHVALVEFRVGDTNYRSRNALEAIGATRTTRSSPCAPS